MPAMLCTIFYTILSQFMPLDSIAFMFTLLLQCIYKHDNFFCSEYNQEIKLNPYNGLRFV